MSYTTNVLVYGAKPENIESVNYWLAKNDEERCQSLQPIDFDGAGGTQFWTADVWAASFNYMPLGLPDVLRNPFTWERCVLSVMVLVDGDNSQEMITFGYVDGEIGAASLRRDHAYDIVRLP